MLMSETQHLQPSDQASKMSIYFAQVWKRRHFIWVMTSERFRSRNLDTYLGKIWNVLNPLLTVLVYYLIFGVVLGVNRGIENFVLWLTIGVFSFRFTQASVIQASSSISSRIGLVRALKFPRLALPISSVLGELLAFRFDIAILIFMTIGTGESITPRVLLLPLIVVAHSVLNLGIGVLSARISESARDIQQVLPFIFMLLRYFSGVMVPASFLIDRGSSSFGPILLYNPLVHICDLYRWILLGDEFKVPVEVISVLLVGTFVLLFLSVVIFAKAEHRYGRP